jgi:hypothetical protein
MATATARSAAAQTPTTGTTGTNTPMKVSMTPKRVWTGTRAATLTERRKRKEGVGPFSYRKSYELFLKEMLQVGLEPTTLALRCDKHIE